LLLAASARADEWPVARGPSREPNPYRYDPKILKEVPRAFLEDTAACLLYSSTTYLVEADGTTETITHEVTRLNGRKGVDTLGEYNSISYDPAYQKLTLNEARVIKPNGQVVKIEPQHVQLRDANTDYSVYGKEKELVISFPNLQVGDVYEVKWTTRGKSPEFGEHFFARYNFGDDRFPVVHDELRVRLPKAKVLKFAPVGGKVEPIVRDVGNDRLYVWRVANRRELPQDSDLPSREELRLQLMCSTFASWEEVGRWKQKLRARCWECTDDIRATVREVTKGLKTPLEKVRALSYWVRRRIRYVSFSSARNGYTPHQPAEVHGNLFGDCKDQAQLLAVMLREAGVPVWLVTLGARDDGQIVPDVPSPWGTHAILLVQVDGKDHWIDTTATLAAWDFLPRGDRDRVAYVTSDKGVRVLRTPALTADDLRYEQETEVWVQPDGTGQCRRTVTYHGLSALTQREAWTDVPAGERRRLMAAELQDANSRTRLRTLEVDEVSLRDPDRDVRATVTFDIPELLAGETDREGSFNDSKVWSRILAYTLDYERQAPLDLYAPFASAHRYTIHLPPGLRFETPPKDREVSSPLGSFTLHVRTDPKDARRLVLELHTRLERSRLSPADFAAFRAFHQQVYKSYRAWLNVTPTRDLDDALALEVLLTWAPGDRASAATLARLYQHHGRPDQALRVVRQALQVHPEDAKLWDLAVAATTSLEEEEGLYREMARRFPDAPRYLVAVGRICVSRGDHDGARAVLEPLTRSGPAAAQARAHYQLARSALARKQPAEALKHLDALVKADVSAVPLVDAKRLCGHAHEKLGQKDQALTAYAEALADAPDDQDLLSSLVRLEIQSDKQDKALDHLRRYTLVVGRDLEGLVQAASDHLELGRFEDALDLAWRAREIGFHERAQRVLGLVYLHRCEYEKAALHLDRAEADAPVLLGLIRAHLALGNLGQAVAYAERAGKPAAAPPELRQAVELVARLEERKRAVLKSAKSVPPERAAACATAVEALVCAEEAYSAGRPSAQVAALLARALPDAVEIGPALALRGLLALEHGRLGKALADAERAIALSPKEPRGYLVRGRVRLERGRDGALADLVRATELSGRRDAVILHWLASALAQVGRHADALIAQREAVRLRPQDPEIVEQLRALERRAARADGARRDS
jgi:tetratricopeptide (TPR) repeat protein/transglutaminase-like putative cysteine protease